MNWEPLMASALDLAQQGRTEVEPNPRVGALAMQDGVVVGRGFHTHWGGPHAEVVALADAAANGAKPDTVVVTLEPCSSPKGEEGKKTEPCTEVLKRAGVRRVVIGAADPDPRHRRNGMAVLEAAGIEVVDGVLSSRCRESQALFHKWLQMDRPWTIGKWAMTLDGKIAAVTGESRWISGPESRRRTHLLRSRCDAVVVGYRTVMHDDPSLTVRHVDGRQPVRVVVDPLAAIDDDSNLVRTAREIPTWLLASEEVDPMRSGHLADLGVQVIHVPTAETNRHLHLRHAWRELRRRGIRRLMVEGGGGLMAELLSWNCVDQVLAFMAPRILGGKFSPTPVQGDGKPFPAEAWRVDDMRCEALGDDLVVTGFVPN
ncbi:MAG: hypothetical protein RIT25_2210 [Planctomycetota bacterium]